jgi:outer membrane protein assembly factor BamB
VRSANSIAFDDRRVYATSTHPEGEILCIRAEGQGDVSESHVEWRVQRGAGSVPSPILSEGRLYVLQDRGVLSCLDADTGASVWQRRLAGDFSASPVIAGSCLYAANEMGTTYVVTLEDPPQTVGTNELDEPIFATPAPSGTSLLIRTAHSLWKIGEGSHGI